MLMIIALSGCTIDLNRFLFQPQKPIAVALKGDVEHGADLFAHGYGEAPPCTTCHSLGSTTFNLGPKMTGISQRAAERIPGMSAYDYLYQSIVDPGAFLVSGYRNIMYPHFQEKLTQQDIADLIAYLETL